MPTAGDGMRIDDKVLENVVFLGVEEKGAFTPKATGFFVSVNAEEFGKFVYLVTAEHVISALATKGHETILIRMNNETGSIVTKVPIREWDFHPDAGREPSDVAVVPVALNGVTNYLSADTSIFVSDKLMGDFGFGVGDEVVVVGLFRNHHGLTKNIPIVRIGGLSAVPTEPVNTRQGWLEAYLVELHSIGGLSGSPVYIHRPQVFVRDGKPQWAVGNRLFLLGLVSGHFDIPNLREDAVVDDATGEGSINSGIGVVIPAKKILETLNMPSLQKLRTDALAKARADGAKLDIADDPPHQDAKAENPRHREDFNRLLGAAVKPRKSSDQT